MQARLIRLQITLRKSMAKINADASGRDLSHNVSTISISGGRLLDPANRVDGLHDLYIADGRVAAVGAAPQGFQAELEIDARDRIVCPGLIDLCARLREPGLETKADIASETRAAASAGITTLICPPDTDPVIDEAAVVELIRRRAEAAGYARVLPLGALTRGLAGEQLAEMAALKQAGCIGVSNALHAIVNTQVARRSLEYAASFGLTVYISPVDPWLAAAGCVHEGHMATRLGLNGIPAAAETAALARDLALLAETGARAHFGRLSSARSIKMIARAQADGLPVSADTGISYLHLCDAAIGRFNSLCHVLPPLRAEHDKDALRTGLVKNALSAICSDHQPHDADAKQGPFAATEPGISGLDTLLPLGLALVEDGVLDLSTLIERLTIGPARVLQLELGQLGAGAVADVCIFDPGQEQVLRAEDMVSRGRNSPFLGRGLPGRVSYTLLAGQIIWPSEE